LAKNFDHQDDLILKRPENFFRSFFYALFPAQGALGSCPPQRIRLILEKNLLIHANNRSIFYGAR
jgi:hypothetical protein